MDDLIDECHLGLRHFKKKQEELKVPFHLERFQRSQSTVLNLNIWKLQKNSGHQHCWKRWCWKLIFFCKQKSHPDPHKAENLSVTTRLWRRAAITEFKENEKLGQLPRVFKEEKRNGEKVIFLMKLVSSILHCLGF